MSHPNCTKCRRRPRRKGQRYCLKCHAAGLRAWRHKHRVTVKEVAELRRDRARLNWLIRGGYTPGIVRPADEDDLRAGRGRESGYVHLGLGGRPEIDAAMKREGAK